MIDSENLIHLKRLIVLTGVILSFSMIDFHKPIHFFSSVDSTELIHFNIMNNFHSVIRLSGIIDFVL